MSTSYDWRSQYVDVEIYRVDKSTKRARKLEERHYTLTSTIHYYTELWKHITQDDKVILAAQLTDVAREYEELVSEVSPVSYAKVFVFNGFIRVSIGVQYPKPSAIPTELPDDLFDELSYTVHNFIAKKKMEMPPEGSDPMDPIDRQAVRQFLECFQCQYTEGRESQTRAEAITSLSYCNLDLEGGEDWEWFSVKIHFQENTCAVKQDELTWIFYMFESGFGFELNQNTVQARQLPKKDREAAWELGKEVMDEVKEKFIKFALLFERLGYDRFLSARQQAFREFNDGGPEVREKWINP